jgi:hypothetical protein
MSWELSCLEMLDEASKGKLTEHLVASSQDWREAQRQMLVVQEAKIAQSVRDLGEISANRSMGGFRIEFEVPEFAVAAWRAKFLMEDLEAGRTGTTGYEFMQHRDWTDYYRKHNPEMCYTEEKRGNQIIVPATPWTRASEVRSQRSETDFRPGRADYVNAVESGVVGEVAA